MKQLFPLIFISVFGVVAHANQILATTSGTLPDGAVSASALFTTSDGQLTIVLSNLLANATSDGQAVSGLEFNFNSAIGGTTSLASDTGTTVSVSGGVGQTNSTVVSAGWYFGTYNSEFMLCIICQSGVTPPGHTAPPSGLILGPGPYTNANHSEQNHSPYIDQTLTVVITNPNITANTGIQDVIFKYSTTFSDLAQTTGQTLPGVPEPGTLVLTAIPAGLLFIGLRRRRPTRG